MAIYFYDSFAKRNIPIKKMIAHYNKKTKKKYGYTIIPTDSDIKKHGLLEIYVSSTTSNANKAFDAYWNNKYKQNNLKRK